MTTTHDRTSGYRDCKHCGDSFAPITSGADDRYSFCSETCEAQYTLRDAQ